MVGSNARTSRHGARITNRLWQGVILMLGLTTAYRIVHDPPTFPYDQDSHKRFVPYEEGFNGHMNEAKDARALRNNEGSPFSESQPRLFEGQKPRQDCPKMVRDPKDEDSYYCTHERYGYCDRRTGKCWCYEGYGGDGCEICAPQYYEEITNGTKLCLPKIYCPSDCLGMGDCDLKTGKCKCYPQRVGEDCSQPFCQTFDKFCVECERDKCTKCLPGYYARNNSCFSCSDFDPRCFLCTKENCLTCLDPLILSIHRSGYRIQDAKLPHDEVMRQLSVTLPFGSQRPEAFQDSETYYLWHDTPNLYESSVKCAQGVHDDQRWVCEKDDFPSHVICGNPGTITLSSPTYVIEEDATYIPITIVRSGGGYNEISVSYDILHMTTDNSDLTDTAFYTSVQRLTFAPGVVQLTFKITINDDFEVEGDEMFQLRLYDPSEGGTLGSQTTAFVTIVDDETARADRTEQWPREDTIPALTPRPDPTKSHVLQVEDKTAEKYRFWRVGEKTHLVGKMIDSNGQSMSLIDSRDRHDAMLIRISSPQDTDLTNDHAYPQRAGRGVQKWSQQRRPMLRHCLNYIVQDTAEVAGQSYNSTKDEYHCEFIPQNTGEYQMDMLLAKRDGLYAEYFNNVWFEGDPVIKRIDRVVNFTWQHGPVTRESRDFVAVRWTGYFRPAHEASHTFYVEADDNVRLWVDDTLLIDRWDNDNSVQRERSINLEITRFYSIKLEYRELDGNAHCRLFYSNHYVNRRVVKAARLYSVRHMHGSPKMIRVEPAATVPANSFPVGEVLTGSVAGETPVFHVVSRDKYRNVVGFESKEDKLFVEAQHRNETTLWEDGGTQWVGKCASRTRPKRKNQKCVDNSHEMSFRLTKKGKYNVFVSIDAPKNKGGKQIFGSPYLFTVQPEPTHAPTSTAVGIGLKKGMTGVPLLSTLTAYDKFKNLRSIGGDEITARMLHHKDHLVYNCKVTDNGDGTYGVSVTVERYGAYKLQILCPYRSTPLHWAQSDYDVFVTYNVATGKSTAEGIGLSRAVAAVTAKFTVQLRDRFSNKRLEGVQKGAALYGFLSSNASKALPVTCQHLQDGLHSCEYKAESSGPQTLSMVVGPKTDTLVEDDDHQHIVGSPFTVLVQDGREEGEYSTAVGVGLKHAMAGVPSSFVVTVRDLYGNLRSNPQDRIRAILTSHDDNGAAQAQPVLGRYRGMGDGPSELRATVTPHDLGEYLVTYNAKISGYYRLDVAVEKTTPPEKNVTTPPPATTTPAGPAAANASTAAANASTTNASAAEPTTTPAPTTAASGSRRKLADTTTTTTTTPAPTTTTTTTYTVYGISEIIGSPFHPYVVPAPTKAGTSNCTGIGLSSGVTGVYAPFDVQARDEFGNYRETDGDLFRVNLRHTSYGGLLYKDTTPPVFPPIARQKGYLVGELKYIDDVAGNRIRGRYTGGYLPLVAGNYSLEVTLAVAGGMTVQYFDVDTFSRDPLAIIRHAEPQIDYHWAANLPPYPHPRLPWDGWSGRWSGLLRPTVSEIFTIIVTTDDSVRMWIEDELVLDKWSVHESASYSIPRGLTAGKYYPFRLEYRDTVAEAAAEGRLRLQWSSLSTPLQVIGKEHWYHYQHVKDSPFDVVIRPAPTAPSTSVASGRSLTRAMTDVTQQFTIQSRDIYDNPRWGGGDNYTVFIWDPNAVKAEDWVVTVAQSIEDLGDSTYRVTYFPTRAGDFLMEVVWGDHLNFALGEVKVVDDFRKRRTRGSPFNIHISDNSGFGPTSTAESHTSREYRIRPQKHITHKGLVGGIVGLKNKFVMQFRDIHGNLRSDEDSLSATLTLDSAFPGNNTWKDPKQLVTNAQVQYFDNGFYYVEYDLQKAGKYSLDILVGKSKRPLKDSPFSLRFDPNYTDPHTTIPVGAALASSKTNITSRFRITTRDTFGNVQNTLLRRDNFTVRLRGPVEVWEQDARQDYKYHGRVLHAYDAKMDTFDPDVTFGSHATYKTGFHTDHFLPGHFQAEFKAPVPGLYYVDVHLADPTPGLRGEYYSNQWLGAELLHQPSPIHEEAAPSPSKVPAASKDAKLNTEKGQHHGLELVRIDNEINMKNPLNQVKGNRLKSVRWTGLIATEYDEKYTFFVTTHPANQVRVSVDNRWVVNRFNVTSIDLDGKGAPANSFNLQGSVVLRSRVLYEINILYRVLAETDAISLEWQSFSQQREVVPRKFLWAGATPLPGSPFRMVVS